MKISSANDSYFRLPNGPGDEPGADAASWSPYRIEYEHRGTYTPRWMPGQDYVAPTQHYHRYRVTTPEGEPVGRMDFSTVDYSDGPEAHIEWIESHQPGAGSALMDRLYADHPEHQIYPGNTTDEGGPFIERWLAKHPEHAARTHYGEA